ncbi:MAG: hypothetical protein ACXVCP_13465 [Bdellovibrio sp.]
MFFIPLTAALGQSEECPRYNPKDLTLKNNAYVNIIAGGTSKNISKEESVGPFNLEAQKKRVTECGSGAAKCFEQLPENIKNGEFLIAYKFKDNSEGIPSVTTMEITSYDFNKQELISCLKAYWKIIYYSASWCRSRL